MELADLKEAVPGLGDKPHNDRILIFGWWLHTHKKKTAFTGADIGKCYSDLHYPAPSSFGGYFQNSGAVRAPKAARMVLTTVHATGSLAHEAALDLLDRLSRRC